LCVEKEIYVINKRILDLNKTRIVMARIAGVDIPKKEESVIALTYIFGLGKK
jgi:hypothetical protein